MRLLAAVLFALLSLPAFAGTGTITGKDAGGVTRTFDVITDGSGNFVWMHGVCDGAAAAQCAAVKAASTAPAATDPAMVVTLSQNAGLGAAATPVRIDPTGTTAQPVSPGTAASWGIGATGSSVPANAQLTGMAQGGNTVALTGTSGNLNVNVAAALAAGSNTIGAVTQASGPWTSNITQVGGTNISTGTGAGGAGIMRVTLSNDSSLAANQSVNINQIGGNSVGDPCFGQVKANVPISTASGTTALVTGVSAKKIYVCSLSLIVPSAVSVSLSEGSSSTCGTSNQAAVIGVATNGTAANGLPLAANGGLTLGNGLGTVASTATAANYLCLFQSGTAQLAGNLTYVQQ